jgi:2-methylaconitate cis-trans-isomerase PrpF
MRGGTSRGPFFLEADLPADPAVRDQVLLASLGSPDRRQIDGLGGAHPLTSKVGIVGLGQDGGVDLDFLFAQVMVDEAKVDTTPKHATCVVRASYRDFDIAWRFGRFCNSSNLHWLNTPEAFESPPPAPFLTLWN